MIKTGATVEITSSVTYRGEKEVIDKTVLNGCKGTVIGERYGDCYVIEFTYVPNKYFLLPCTQVIGKKYVKETKVL